MCIFLLFNCQRKILAHIRRSTNIRCGSGARKGPAWSEERAGETSGGMAVGVGFGDI